jgi:ABC-type sugar transport system, permease component
MESIDRPKRATGARQVPLLILLVVLSVLFIFPILIVLVNSFKSSLYVTEYAFTLPDNQTFVGIYNYLNGINLTGFISAFGWSLFITVGSVLAIVFFTSMTAWFITRVKAGWCKAIYYGLIFSMVVPFQMVMYTTVDVANKLHLDNPVGMLFLYLGFGAGLSTFMFCGFIKSVPLEVEESAMIDGCNPIQLFFSIVIPMLKPIVITVTILNTMWVWNDYLLPSLVIGTDYRTIPIAIQYLRGGYGSIDMGAMMAMLVLAIIPIIIFYAFCQKYIVEGVVAGSVKG